MSNHSERSGLGQFVIGSLYTRKDIFDILQVPQGSRSGGNWFTGYNKYGGENYLFVNVMTPGRTGHDYKDHWIDEDTLFWHGKTHSHINQPSIQSMIGPNSIVHIFTRDDSRDVNFV